VVQRDRRSVRPCVATAPERDGAVAVPGHDRATGGIVGDTLHAKGRLGAATAPATPSAAAAASAATTATAARAIVVALVHASNVLLTYYLPRLRRRLRFPPRAAGAAPALGRAIEQRADLGIGG